ncbi:MAG: AraC family transcriptional regulator [Burkholderiales bacterium]|nr:AraC family transcriptional regulator [Burkholderiales bacterium]
MIKLEGADETFVVDGNPYRMTDDAAILVNTWTEHWYPHSGNPKGSLCLAMYIEPEWLAELDRDFRLSCRPDFFPRSCVSIPQDVRETARAIAEEIKLSDRADLERIRMLIFDLMATLVGRYSLLSQHDTCLRLPPVGYDHRIRRALMLLEASAGRPVRTETLLSAAALSRPRFFQLFKEQTGLTPVVYGNAVRLESVLHDMVRSDQAMAEIASRHGFSEQSNFTRFFRQHTGVPPAAYRRRLLDESTHRAQSPRRCSRGAS